MAAIDDILNRILKAIHGKDVRQSIHDGVKIAYDQSTSAKTTAEGIDGKATRALDAANQAKTTAEGINGKATQALTAANAAAKVAQEAKDAADDAADSVESKIDKDFGGSTSYSQIVTYGPTPTGVSVSHLAIEKLSATESLPDDGYTIRGLSSHPRNKDAAVNKEYVDTRLAEKIESKWAGTLPYASTQLVMYDNTDGMIVGYVPNAKLGINVRNGGVGNYTFALGNCGLDPVTDDELVNYGFMKSYIGNSVNRILEYLPTDKVFCEALNHDVQYSIDDVIDMCDYGLGNVAFPIIVYNSRVYRCEHLHRDTFSQDDRLIASLDFMSTEQQTPIGYVHTMTISRDAEVPVFKSYQHNLTPYES